MSIPGAQEPAKTCFVAMPITTPTTYAEKLGDPEHFTHVLAHLFTPAIQAAGLTVVSPSVGGSEMIHAEIIKNLEQADLVLCDLSDLNPNVLFELGIRTSLDRPVMLVKDNLTGNIPFDINAISMATYDSSLKPWSLAAEVARLTEFIQKVASNANPGNAMWRYFGLTKRAAPSRAGDNPVEAKLDLIISELTKHGNLLGPSSDSDALAPPVASLRYSDIAHLLAPHIESLGLSSYKITGPMRKRDRDGMIVEISTVQAVKPSRAVTTAMKQALRANGYDNLEIAWLSPSS